MQREIMRVDPIWGYREAWKMPTSHAPSWPGPFDVEIGCIAARSDTARSLWIGATASSTEPSLCW